ncbi:MAG: DUF935 family protein [Armatimonadota bacterium]|nr:DUF935 family protein [Armatimonadota bacterium]
MGVIAQIRAAWRALSSRQAPPLGELAVADPRLWAGGWWPNPSQLVGTRGLGIFDRMMADDQVKAAISFKRAAVLATGWEVVAPDSTPEAAERAAFVRWCLESVEGSFHDDLWQVLSALVYGYSVTELVWERVADGPYKDFVRLRALKTRRPHDFAFELDAHGNITGLVQMGQRLPPGKFLIFTHDAEFGNPYGRSDLEAAFRHWWVKDNALKWLAMLLERLGIPMIYALYDPTRYTPDQTKELHKLIESLQAGSGGLIPRPDAQSLEFWTPELAGQATRVFLPALEYYDRAIARAVLMPGLLGLTTEGAVGSYARARISFDVFLLIIEKLRGDLTEAVNEQVVRRLVDVNWPSGPYPIWRLLPLTDEVRLDILDRWMAAVGAGVVRSGAADEEFIRRMLRFPPASPEAAGPASPGA